MLSSTYIQGISHESHYLIMSVSGHKIMNIQDEYKKVH